VRDVQAAGGAALTRPRAVLVLLALNALVLDQATKRLVVSELEGQRSVRLLDGLVTLHVSRNSGAAFSFAEGMTVVFTAIAFVVAVVIVRAMPRLRSTGWAVTLGLLLGGAVGNLVDRLAREPGFARGAVVDFIQVPHFATFNVADSAITVGAALAVLLSLRGIEIDGSHRHAEDEGRMAA
jgi:lipoprotein signal peptidase